MYTSAYFMQGGVFMNYEDYKSLYFESVVKDYKEGLLTAAQIMQKYNLHHKVFYKMIHEAGLTRKSEVFKMNIEEYKKLFLKDCIRVFKEQGAFTHRIYKKYGRFYYKDINRLFGSISNLLLQQGMEGAQFSRKSQEDLFFERLERDFGLKPLYRRYKGFKWLHSDHGQMEIDAVYDKPFLFGIEFDDQSHFEIFRGDDNALKLKRRKLLDSLKDSLCKENNFQLIRFAYNEDLSREAVLRKLNSISKEINFCFEGKTDYSMIDSVEIFKGLEDTGFGKYSARVFLQKTIGGIKQRTNTRLGSYYHPLLAAIAREKFLLDNPEYNSVRNDISLKTLNLLGFENWDAVTKEKLQALDKGGD